MTATSSRQGRDWTVTEAGVASRESVYGRQSDGNGDAENTVRDLGGGEVRIEGRDKTLAQLRHTWAGRESKPPRDKKYCE
jgi:hypothetical protein